MELLKKLGRSIRRLADSLRNPSRRFLQVLNLAETTSGVTVNTDTALSYSALYCAVTAISQDIAGLPLPVYERLPRGKQLVRNDRISDVLRVAPNPMMGPYMFWEMLIGYMLTWGNGYAWIQGNREIGEAQYLWPLPSNIVHPEIRDGSLIYDVEMEGLRIPIEPKNIIHIRMIGGDGVCGWSPIRLHREAIGLGLATEQHGAAMFGNGARPGGIITVAGPMDKAKQQEFMDSWNRRHQGPGKAARISVMPQGSDWKQIGLPNDDAQFLETRKFQVQEIARIYRLPNHMLGELTDATYSNIEHQGRHYLIHTLRPHLVRIEEEINLKLLDGGRERFCEFLVEGLLRGDTESRFKSYAIAITNGFMTRNEVRERENMNPLEGGDEPLVPVNTAQPTKSDRANEETEETAFLNALQDAADSNVQTAWKRIVTKECKIIRDVINKNGQTAERFMAWARGWYEKYVREAYATLLPAFNVLAVANGRTRFDGAVQCEQEAKTHCEDALSQLETACHKYRFIEAVSSLCESWECD